MALSVEQMDTFATRLKKARKARGMTQRDLSQALGVRDMTVSEWERGMVAAPDPKAVLMAAEILGVDAHWLLRGAEAKPARVDLPPALEAFLSTEEAQELQVTPSELAVLVEYGRALVAEGYRPTPQLYQASLAQMRIAPRATTKH
jgi:transcriptional regulator with XRE-family HTH domain